MYPSWNLVTSSVREIDYEIRRQIAIEDHALKAIGRLAIALDGHVYRSEGFERLVVVANVARDNHGILQRARSELIDGATGCRLILRDNRDEPYDLPQK
jgi:hypothetical protein